jgi:hypothetical protein
VDDAPLIARFPRDDQRHVGAPRRQLSAGIGAALPGQQLEIVHKPERLAELPGGRSLLFDDAGAEGRQAAQSSRDATIPQPVPRSTFPETREASALSASYDSASIIAA